MMFLMNLLNKVSKKLRWLRWSTVFAIMFYMFFIGLILHTTTYKLQHNSVKSHQDKSQLKPQQQLENKHEQQQQEKPLQVLTEKISQRESKISNAVYETSTNSRNSDNLRRKANIDVMSLHQTTTDMSSAALLSSALASALVSMAVAEAATNSGQFTKKPHQQKNNAFTSTTMTDTMRTTKATEKAKPNVVHNQETSRLPPQTVILVAATSNEKHILEKAFKRADKNKDNYLSIKELAQYINRNIVDHIDEAIRLNAKEFRRVDISPADGLITWDEYHRFFLKEHGMTEADIDEHNEIKHTALNRKAREDMMRDKARWSEAARTDLFTLTIDEYLSFRHPESSISNLLELVDDLLRQFDQDGDDQLSIEEFSEVNVADDEDLMRKSLISKTVVERKEEFKRIIDKNHDGQADRGELLNYVNPKAPRYALQEAATLFSLCDDDRNNKLTLDELLSNAEIFLTSKMIDTAHSFHTEF